jgi:hypothetical protein
MSGHTPGPWVVTSADWPDDEPGIVRYYVRHDPAEISFPNARLIAAAPDLLSALKAYVEWFGGAHVHGCPADDTCDCPGSAVNALVNAAFAKAEGR